MMFATCFCCWITADDSILEFTVPLAISSSSSQMARNPRFEEIRQDRAH